MEHHPSSKWDTSQTSPDVNQQQTDPSSAWALSEAHPALLKGACTPTADQPHGREPP